MLTKLVKQRRIKDWQETLRQIYMIYEIYFCYIYCQLSKIDMWDNFFQRDIGKERINILRNHHTATLIVFCSLQMSFTTSCLVNGAKKTHDSAYFRYHPLCNIYQRVGISHRKLSQQNYNTCQKISKSSINKAEQKKNMDSNFVTGNETRVVKIYDTDVEACCGTHIDSTYEVGWVRILKTQKLQDGIVRLYYVAGVNTIEILNQEFELINHLTKMFSIPENNYLKKLRKHFKTRQHFENQYLHQKLNQFNPKSNLYCQVLKYQCSCLFNEFGQYVLKLKQKESSLIFLANNYWALNLMLATIQEQDNTLNWLNKIRLIKDGKNQYEQQIYILTFSLMGKINKGKVIQYLNGLDFQLF